MSNIMTFDIHSTYIHFQACIYISWNSTRLVHYSTVVYCILKESVKQFGCHDFSITYSTEYSYLVHYYLMPILQEDDKEDVDLRTVDHLFFKSCIYFPYYACTKGQLIL